MNRAGLPDAWRLGVLAGDAPVEARRLAPSDDFHAFGGVAIQGTLEQVRILAWVAEREGRKYQKVAPLRRRPRSRDFGGRKTKLEVVAKALPGADETPASAEDIGAIADVSIQTVRRHLKTLLGQGRVVAVSPNRPGAAEVYYGVSPFGQGIPWHILTGRVV